MKKIILIIAFAFFHLFFIIHPFSVEAADILSCRNTDNYNQCWADTNRINCAFLVDTDTQAIDPNETYCTNNQGTLCKFTNENITCKHQSLNPVQSAVSSAASKNSNQQRIKWEVFLEPGEFPIRSFMKPNTGFGRVGVIIPSLTKLSGAILNNSQLASIYIPQDFYENIDQACITQWSRGGCVLAVIGLTNLDGIYTYDPKRIYQESMANPVNNVNITGIRILGVGGPNYINQSIDANRKAALRDEAGFCSDDHCFYRYTSLWGIYGPRLSGGNIKITQNLIQLYPWNNIRLGAFFDNISMKDITNGQINDLFQAYMMADGLPNGHIIISNNTVDGSLQGEGISVWGSYMDIVNNKVINGYGDWTGNQIAISPYIDSHHIGVINNNIDSWPVGVNFEGIMTAGDIVNFPLDALYNSPRVAHDNLAIGNRITNVLDCINPQRQIRLTVSDNTCSIDLNKARKLMSLNYYSTTVSYKFLENLVGRSLTPQEALQNNAGLIGTGIFMRTSQNSTFSNNSFTNVSRPIYLDGLKLLPGGIMNNQFNNNVFSINPAVLTEYHNYAASQGFPDTFYNVYWPSNDESSNNSYCNNNQSDISGFQINGGNRFTTGIQCANFTPPKTCFISLSTGSITTAGSVTAGSTGTGGSVVQYVSRTDTDSISGLGQPVWTDSQGHKYYAVTGSSVGGLTQGTYKFWCNQNDEPNKCSGNPFCQYEGGPLTTECDGWVSCSTSDNATLSVMINPIPGDINSDGKVNIDDFSQFIANFTNIFDYNKLVTNYGEVVR